MVLQRSRTVTAHVPIGLGPVDRKSFLSALLGSVRKEDVKCVQDMRKYFRVTFVSEEIKDHFSSRGLKIRGIQIPFLEADESRVVRLFNIPFEVPEGNVKAVLSLYGTVISHQLEVDRESGIYTGTRLLRMRINKPIPDRLTVLDYPFVAWYPGQPKVCRVCQAVGHVASACPNKGLCRLCRAPGHIARLCPNRGSSEPSTSANPWQSRSRVPVSSNVPVASASSDSASVVPAPVVVPVASTSNDSTSVAPAPVDVPAAAAAAAPAAAAAAAVAAELPAAPTVAHTVAAKSVTAARTSKNVPRDIGLTEYSDVDSDSDNMDTDSIDSFQSSEELMEEDLPLGCGRLQIDLDDAVSISSFASGATVVDCEEMSSSPPSTMVLFPNTSVSQDMLVIPESSLENTGTSLDVLDSGFIPVSPNRFDALQVLSEIEWPSLPGGDSEDSDSDV